ncbi:DUF5995 family protein [Mycobacterium celatum]|uniref:DUF5995 family protein n=1 Tax=Mycobacterium celatum TaxID=28045 RepID=UPI00078107DF|nr:DUF5995 family protein [Mycobacterium celatum]
MAGRVLPLQRLNKVKSIDDVVDNLDKVIAWSIKAQSTIGYFASLYKRTTVAIREAVKEGKFDDPQRMQKFDIVFAQRYFNALNSYFHVHQYDGLTLPWEVAFIGHTDSQATMIQQLMAAINVHIGFDLGIAAAEVSPNALKSLAQDFNRVNAILAGQIPGMLGVVDQLSPELRRIRRVVPNEIWFIKRVLFKFRAAAWDFATDLALHPENARGTKVNHASWTAAMGAWYLQPPARMTLVPVLVRVVGKRESRDVAANIRAIAGITDKPEKALVRAFL